MINMTRKKKRIYYEIKSTKTKILYDKFRKNIKLQNTTIPPFKRSQFTRIHFNVLFEN